MLKKPNEEIELKGNPRQRGMTLLRYGMFFTDPTALCVRIKNRVAGS
jgi:hypothetical protein